MTADLKEIRGQLDGIDDQLTDLFARRMRLVAQVAEIKQAQGLPILDTGREREIVNRLTLRAGEDLERHTKLLYQTLFSVSRAYQAERIHPADPGEDALEQAVAGAPVPFPARAMVACQGTEGAYAQQACTRMFEYADILYMNTFNDVFNAVEKGMCPFGVLPIENSTAGSVTQVYDLMEQHRFHIVRAVRQRIEHRLLALPGAELAGIREVVSHEQALRQCDAFLAAHPGIRVTPMANTAMAAAYVASSGRRDLAAIASRESGMLYGLETLGESVANTENNYTRFICIARDMTVYEGAGKISLMLSAAHRPGSLCRLLSHIAAAEVNLTKLESRPIPGKDFEFRFFFDIEASLRKESVRTLIRQLRGDADRFVLLGNYEELR
ncbi:MAG: chorismate mutase [Clostridia bacterium]|nr:chorismate mutase [Clostridia bacterium]